VKDSIDFRRGYTGHEHMPEFGLINMNGRLYDPLLGRFLSPDPYVQMPDFSQNYNRYSYCLNNPLKYTDPSGELFGIDDMFIVSAVIGIAKSMMDAAYNGQNIWKAGGISLLTSVASCALPYAANGIGNLLGHHLGSVGTEILRAGAHGLVSGTYYTIQGGNFGVGFATGAFSSLAGSGAAAFGLGSLGTVASSTIMGALTSGIMGDNLLDGAMIGFNIGAFNHNGDNIIDGGDLDEVEVIGIDYSKFARLQTRMEVNPFFLGSIGKGIAWGTKAFVPLLKKILHRNVKEKMLPSAVKYTKSNLKLGREMHKKYRQNEYDNIFKFKEFRGIKGIRPDFVDFSTNTIYELKPFNPNGIKSGLKQLDKYKKAFIENYPGYEWKTVLDYY